MLTMQLADGVRSQLQVAHTVMVGTALLVESGRDKAPKIRS